MGAFLAGKQEERHKQKKQENSFHSFKILNKLLIMQHASRRILDPHLPLPGVHLQQRRPLLVEDGHIIDAPVSHRHRHVHPAAKALEKQVQRSVFLFPEIDAERIGVHRLVEGRKLPEAVEAVSFELFGSLAPFLAAGALEELEDISGDRRSSRGRKRLLSVAGQSQQGEQEQTGGFHSGSIKMSENGF